MKYICNECNYESYDKSHFDRHKKTKKHEQNVHNINKLKNSDPKSDPSDPKSDPKKSITCNLCGIQFTTKTNMYRHKRKVCKNIKNASIAKNEMSDNEEIKNLKKQNQELMDIVKSQSKSVENNSETIKKSMNVLSYVTKQYPNAPAIEELEYDKFDQLSKSLMYDKSKNKINHSIEEIILFHFKNNTLPETLGSAIVEEYKKDNPEDQSMWASDVSRLAFIVKSAIGSTKKSKWIQDKNGIHFMEMIIQPMFDIIKNKLRKYVKYKILEESNVKNKNVDDVVIKFKNMHIANELIKMINSDKYNRKVLKYVAPYFNLNIDDPDSESDVEELA